MRDGSSSAETPGSDLDDFDDAQDIDQLDREEAEKAIIEREKAVKSLEDAGADAITPEEEEALFKPGQQNREHK